MTSQPPRPLPRDQLVRTERSLPIALLRARETVMGPVRDMLADSQISEQKWRVLRVLAEDGAIEQTSIARRACLLLPSLTRILRSMEQDGLITREPGTDDRRKSIVSISAKGLEIIDANAAQSQELSANLKAAFGEDNLEQLLDLLEKLRRTQL